MSMKRAVSRQIDITFSTNLEESTVLVDGEDITHWIASKPVIIRSTSGGFTEVVVTLTAPTVNVTLKP